MGGIMKDVIHHRKSLHRKIIRDSRKEVVEKVEKIEEKKSEAPALIHVRVPNKEKGFAKEKLLRYH